MLKRRPLLPIIGYCSKSFNSWMKAKVSQIEEDEQRKTLEKYVDMACGLTQDVVDYLNTTMVNDLKLASEDGHLTEEDAKTILNKAKVSIITKLGVTGQSVLENAFGDLDVLLNIWITNATERAKMTTGLTSAKAIELKEERRMTQSLNNCQPSKGNQKK